MQRFTRIDLFRLIHARFRRAYRDPDATAISLLLEGLPFESSISMTEKITDFLLPKSNPELDVPKFGDTTVHADWAKFACGVVAAASLSPLLAEDDESGWVFEHDVMSAGELILQTTRPIGVDTLYADYLWKVLILARDKGWLESDDHNGADLDDYEDLKWRITDAGLADVIDQYISVQHPLFGTSPATHESVETLIKLKEQNYEARARGGRAGARSRRDANEPLRRNAERHLQTIYNENGKKFGFAVERTADHLSISTDSIRRWIRQGLIARPA